MSALSEVLEKVDVLKKLPVFKLLGINMDEVDLRHALVEGEAGLDKALDYMDDLALTAGAGVAVIEVEIKGQRATALIVLQAASLGPLVIEGAPDSRALPVAAESP